MQKMRFTAASIARLKPKDTRYLVRNANLAGHYLRIYPDWEQDPLRPYARPWGQASLAPDR